jgi:WD40 repeat protein
VATASSDRTAKLWDAESGKLQATLLGHRAGVTIATFAPDGRTLATGSHDGTLRLWNVKTGQEMLVLEGPGGWVVTPTFSPEGQTLAAGFSGPKGGDEILLWSAPRGNANAGLHKGDGEPGG